MKKIISLTALVMLLLLVFVPIANASPIIITSDNTLLEVNQKLSDDAYIAGSNISISEVVEGDLYVVGQNITINADIKGDLIAIGDLIIINANIGDDARIAASRSVQLSGNVGDDVFVATNHLMISENSIIKGDLYTGTQTLTMDGTVEGDLKSRFLSATVNGSVSGNADVYYADGKLIFGSDAGILGVLNYYSLSESISFSDIAKEANYIRWTNKYNSPFMQFGAGTATALAFFTFALWEYFMLLVLGGILILLIFKYLKNSATIQKTGYLNAIWVGLLFTVLTPLVGIIALLSFIGIPIAVFIGLVFALVIFLSKIVGSIMIGNYFTQNNSSTKGNIFKNFALGALIYILLGAIPIIGWLAKIIIVLVAVGSIVINTKKLIKEEK